MARTFGVVSQKGGVGKTSLVQNLGAELALAGRRVLQVDLDPQSNLTVGWGIDPVEERLTVIDALENPAQTADAIIHLRERLDLMPADLDLAAAELAYINAIDRNYKLKKALAPVADEYDIILIDAPPSLGFFTVNSLAAASDILIPLQVHPYAYKAISQLLVIVEQVREINNQLNLFGIILTMWDQRNSLTGAIEQEARRRFDDLVFETVVPINVRIPEATLEGLSVGEYEPSSSGARAYSALAKEMIHYGA